MTKGRAIAYSLEERHWLAERRHMPRRELHQRFCDHFCRSDVSLDHIKSYCTRQGWKTGRSGQFPKGHVPANKGKKMPYNANSAATQFKKGHLGGRARDLLKPIGYERISKNGYLERKVNNELPFQDRWKEVHRINWEAEHGPVPDGHCLKCLDGNKLNTAAANWQLIDRALLPRLNGRWTGNPFDSAEPEVKPTILATAELQHRVRRATRKIA